MGEPHVRVNLAERVLVTWLLLDTSPSMQFGTGDRRKADVADGVAIAVGHIATRRGNRLGVVTFGDSKPVTLPPHQGRVGLLGLLEALQREPEEGQTGATSLGDAISRTAAIARQRGVVVIVSDFRGPLDWRKPLLQLMSRHDVLAVEIRDPREQELPDVGDLWLVDPETGRQVRVDTRSRSLRERFAGRGRRGAKRRRARALGARSSARGALDLRRLAAPVRNLPRSTPVSFGQPLVLIALVVVPALVRRSGARRIVAARRRPRRSRHPPCCRTSSPSGPGCAGRFRSRFCCSRSSR